MILQLIRCVKKWGDAASGVNLEETFSLQWGMVELSIGIVDSCVIMETVVVSRF